MNSCRRYADADNLCFGAFGDTGWAPCFKQATWWTTGRRIDDGITFGDQGVSEGRLSLGKGPRCKGKQANKFGATF